MLALILRTLAQPSTYAGLAGVASAVGLSAPEFSAIAGAVAAVAGALGVVLQERTAG